MIESPFSALSKLKPLALLSFAVACLVLCASCGRKQAPDPPAAKPLLLLDIYYSMEKGDHKAALNKILRLKEIDKSSVFLAELEALERNNMYLVETNRLLDSGDAAAAAGILDGALKRHGTIEAILDAKRTLATLKEASSLLDVLGSSRSSESMREAALRLREIADSCKPLESLGPLAAAKLLQAEEMARFETKLRAIDLRFDAEALFRVNSPDAACLASQFGIEAQRDPALKRFVGALRSSAGYRGKLIVKK